MGGAKLPQVPPYPNDEEVFLKVADLPSGDLLCVLFNLGLDPIEKTELVFDRKISEIEKLLPDGTKSKVAFASTDGRCILDTSCDTLNPLVLFVR